MSEFVIELKGLGCPNCASKIERDTQKMKGIKEANMNFPNQTMIVKLDDSMSVDAALNQITEIVHSHESEVKVLLKSGKSKSNYVENDKKSHSHSHEHSHDHSSDESDNELKFKFIRFGIGVVVFIASILIKLPSPINLILFISAYLIFGFDVVMTAAKNILKGDFFDENFLMSIATIGAFIIGDYPEAVAVMLFYQIGEILQDIAVGRSRKSIKSMMDIRPDFAHKIVGSKTETVNPETINIGDIILIKPGEKVPLDGIVEEGSSMLDTKALTGEAVPRTVNVGDEVLSGVINQTGVIKLKVTKSFGESTASKILELLENASAKKAPTEKFITKFARYYTPIVVFIALAVAVLPPIITGDSFSVWVSRALTMLVISCPCAIVVSIPLSFFSGIGTASSKGILVKGSSYLQALNELDTVIFDKTGTLTEGVFEVVDICPNDCTFETLLKCTAIAEYHSNHPIAKSILNKYNSITDKPITESIIQNYEEIAGYGVKVATNGDIISAGNIKLMYKEGLSPKESESKGTVVYTSLNNKYLGYLVISDKLKADSKEAIINLNKLGISNTIMLTGDREASALDTAEKVGIKKVYYELLPNQKVEKLEEAFNSNAKGKIAFVGDGINDAPVLARADIGIAMGGVGSDAAIEAADIVIMNDEPSKIAEGVIIAKHTNKIVWENIIFALGIKGIFLTLGAFGIANMWLAVFADVGVTLLAVINSMRKPR